MNPSKPQERIAGLPEHLDSDALILAAERAVVERDQRVRQNINDTKVRFNRNGRFILVLGGVTLLFWRLLADRGLSRPSATVTHSPRKFSVLRGLGLLLPFLPKAMAPSGIPALVAGLLIPFFEQRRSGRVQSVSAQTRLPPLPAVQSAEGFELDRYLGSWYEIARTAAPGKTRYAKDVITTYELIAERALSVTHRSRKMDGTIRMKHGVARPVEGYGSGRFRLSFYPIFLRWLPSAWSDYWILMVDANYRYALAGTPDRKKLWLLSRTPSLDAVDEQRLVDYAQRQYFETEKLIRTGSDHESIRIDSY